MCPSLLFLSSIEKFKAHFEILTFCSIRIKGTSLLFKESVNKALIRVNTSLIFKDSFLG